MRSSKGTVSEDLKKDIKSRVRGAVSIIGIGNIMRGDDGCGPRLIEELKKRSLKAHLFDCGTVPENYIFPILTTSCDTVIMVDAADFGMKPGVIKLFALEEVSGAGLSTHNFSLRLFTDLLKTGRDGLNIFVISIQPKRITLGENLSEEVRAGVDSLADLLAEALA